jgi:hypothetical protein
MALSLNGTSGISGVDGSAGTPALQGSDTNTGISFGTDTVNINTGGTTRATVDSSGRVLVGTSSAISGGVIDSGSGSQSSLPYLQIAGTDWAQSSAVFASYQNAAAVFPQISLNKSKSGTVGTIGVALASGDALGGITFSGSDGTKFVAGASIASYVDGTPGNNDMPGRLVFSTTADGASSPTERMRIDSNGKIQVNTTNIRGGARVTIEGVGADSTSSGLPLSINDTYTTAGGGSYAVTFYRVGSLVGSITTTASATGYNTSSDYRLKENVTTVTDGITRLQQLKPSRFNFIVDPDKTVDGFLAHEVQAVVPEAITGDKDAVDEDGNPVYQGIDQSKLVPLLTAALQEAVSKIESLETRLTALEGGTNP